MHWRVVTAEKDGCNAGSAHKGAMHRDHCTDNWTAADGTFALAFAATQLFLGGVSLNANRATSQQKNKRPTTRVDVCNLPQLASHNSRASLATHIWKLASDRRDLEGLQP